MGNRQSKSFGHREEIKAIYISIQNREYKYKEIKIHPKNKIYYIKLSKN